MKLHDFYEMLFKHNSYHNAYYRVKNLLIEKRIIKVTNGMIELTNKGNSLMILLDKIKILLSK